MVRLDIQCNLCGRSHFKTIEDHEPPFKVIQCTYCKLVFVNPFPEKASLAEHYDENYYTEWLTTQSKSRLRMWERRLNKLERFEKRGSLLDVGCATGAFLELAKKRGWKVSGTELSPYAARYAENILGIPIFCGDLPDSPYPGGSFDVVTMWHVLEHVTDPANYLRKTYDLLKPNGLLVIAVPNVDDHIMRIAYQIVKGKRRMLFSKDEREVHLFHFSARTLKAYLEKTGYNCLRIGADFGEVNYLKKTVNMISVIFSQLTGTHMSNAIEVLARRER
jgi:2-polyprenyl-3-methyl-5-hydroxy-6-metoxy-1,4-benzoquinol methylase